MLVGWMDAVSYQGTGFSRAGKLCHEKRLQPLLETISVARAAPEGAISWHRVRHR
jgi:hypothetical protein